MLCTTVVHNDMHTHMSSSYKLSVGLGFGVLCICLGLAFCVFFGFSLDYFILAFVVLGLVSSVLCQEIGKRERLLFCVEWDIKP